MRTSNFFCVCICLAASLSHAAERPTLLKTCDPRPDILPRPFYDNHTEYRAQYNRPRFYTGWLAYEVSRTSQEAMVWKENYCAGNYIQHHMPPIYKTYNYPKPWEALNVGARPDFASAKPKTERVPAATASEGDEATSQSESIRKPNAEDNDEATTTKASEDDKSGVKSDAQDAEDKSREVVPSPSDKTSSRPTSLKPRLVKPKPSLRKAS